MFKCRLYYNTGFNAINVPDNYQTLQASGTMKEFSALDILQIMPLSSVSIKINNEKDVRDADYMELLSNESRAFYSIEGYTLTSPDVAVLSITLNPMLTIGGADYLKFLDGVTIRHHVSKAEDLFGAFSETDPLLVPSKPLEIIEGGVAYNSSGEQLTLCESTIDLSTLADVTTGSAYQAGGESCVVPELSAAIGEHGTNILMINPNGDATSENLKTYAPGAAYYDISNEKVQNGIKRARSLGVEGIILNQWIIDKKYIESAKTSISDTTGLVQSICGGNQVATEVRTLPYKYATVNNLRVLYGELNEYVLVSIASGNSAYYLPEDIVETDAAGKQTEAPVITMAVDCRPDGKPYYRFRSYKGSRNNFFVNCVPGLAWQTAPLIYHDKSGSEIDTMRYLTTQSILRENSIVAQARAIRGAGENFAFGLLGASPELGQSVEQYSGGYEGSTYPSIIAGRTGILSFLGNAVRSAYTFGAEALGYATGNSAYSNAANLRRQFENAKQNELQNFNISQNLVVPQINFPRSNSIRDFIGNGIFAYRYRPADSDVSKLDKILTMYGYKDTKPVSVDLLKNRSKFNYVQAVGVSIDSVKFSNDMTPSPKWLREAVSQQFAAGVRIWHVKPDENYYTNGENV